MITEVLFSLLFGIINSLVSFFPLITIPSAIIGGIAGFSELMVKICSFMPVGAFVVCVGWMFVLYNFKFVMSLINWVIRKIPSIS